MHNIAFPNAEFVGLWLQTLVTGVYYVYFPQCVIILWKKWRREGISLLFPGVCITMFLIVTVVLINGMIAGCQAFCVSGTNGEIPPNPNLFYAKSATPSSLLNNSMIVALALISDLIMVYRTFIVWSFSLLAIAIPVGFLCADIAFGIWATWTLAHTPDGDSPILDEVAVRVKYFFVFTFCVNVLCAGLICVQIWRVSLRWKSPLMTDDRTMSRVLEVVTETAALYCAHLFALIVSDAIGSNAFFTFLDFLPPVTALVFSLLIVRTQTGTTLQTTGSLASRPSNLRFWSSSAHAVSRTARVQSGQEDDGVQISRRRLEDGVRSETENLPAQMMISIANSGDMT